MKIRADTPQQVLSAMAADMRSRAIKQNQVLDSIASRTDKLRAEGRKNAFIQVADVLRETVVEPLEPGEKTAEEKLRAEFALSQADGGKEAMAEYLQKVRRSAESLAEDLVRRIADIHDWPHDGAGSTHTNPEDIFAFALNDVENFMRNVNLGHASSVATRYATARVELGRHRP